MTSRPVLVEGFPSRIFRICGRFTLLPLMFEFARHCLANPPLKPHRGFPAAVVAGQTRLCLNYASVHWTQPGENPPVGIILCAGKSSSLVRYATDNLPNKVLVREYLTSLPDEKRLAAEIDIAREKLGRRR